jgi:inorganic pyrophosphatase
MAPANHVLFSNAELPYIVIIYAACILGMIWAWVQSCGVKAIKSEDCEKIDNMQPLNDDAPVHTLPALEKKIQQGARAFLFAEYRIMSIFIVIFAIIVWLIVDYAGGSVAKGTRYMPYATMAFIIGAFTSIYCGWIGMTIAVEANYRVAYQASLRENGLEKAFATAYKAGCVMGFGLVSISLMVLTS